MAAPASFPRQLRVNQVSGAVVSSAMRVHSVLGPGLLESAYQGCLAHELRKRGFAVATQVGPPVVFDGEKIELAIASILSSKIW
jgi:GxxExxY protein